MNNLYGKGRQRFLQADIDWLVDDIKAVLVDTDDYTVSIDVHEFLSDIPVGARVATSANLTTKTSTLGVADADDVTFTGVTGDEFEAVVLYKDTGAAATSPLIMYADVGTNLPVLPNGGSIILQFSSGATKIFKL
jgi:hypothetical protein